MTNDLANPDGATTRSSPIQLYLSRHGRTAWNEQGRFQGHTDVPLDHVGRAQAAALAEALRGRIDTVASSDLLRASQTAQIVCDLLALPLLALDPDLRERGYGVFEGLTAAECLERFPEPWAARELDRNREPPSGELRVRVIARMQHALERVVTTLRRSGQRALVVSHGSSLRMFLETLTQEPVRPIGNSEYVGLVHDGRGFSLPPPLDAER